VAGHEVVDLHEDRSGHDARLVAVAQEGGAPLVISVSEVEESDQWAGVDD